MDITGIDLAAFTGFSVYLTPITAALAASVDVCVIPCIMFCLATFLFHISCLGVPFMSLPYFLHVGLPYMKLHIL